MKHIRLLPAIALGVAIAVGVATVLPPAGIIPHRSLGSLLVGSVVVVGSYIEVILASLLAYRLTKTEKHRSIFEAACLAVALLATIPAILVTRSLL